MGFSFLNLFKIQRSPSPVSKDHDNSSTFSPHLLMFIDSSIHLLLDHLTCYRSSSNRDEVLHSLKKHFVVASSMRELELRQ